MSTGKPSYISLTWSRAATRHGAVGTFRVPFNTGQSVMWLTTTKDASRMRRCLVAPFNIQCQRRKGTRLLRENSTSEITANIATQSECPTCTQPLMRPTADGISGAYTSLAGTRIACKARHPRVCPLIVLPLEGQSETATAIVSSFHFAINEVCSLWLDKCENVCG
ncbi:hypothetical protein FIBSPDRAFT_941771, partial [Athelia psychrophila]